MKVDVSQDSDVSASDPGDNSVTVVTDFEVEVIRELEQGPPGPQGAQGNPGKDGNTVLYGTADPAPFVGVDGNFYINTTTHFLFGPKTLGVWPAGTSMVGPQGPRGNSVLYGAGAPAAGTGIDGDFYIDTTAHFIYGPKAGGAWPAGISLIGPQGPQGIQGNTGQRGSLWYEGAGAPGAIAGVLANDNYLNTTNGDVYNYASGSWGSPVGNIRGPQGIPGAIAEAPTDGAYYTRRNGAWVDAAGAFVRFDAAQALTAAQQLQSRQNVYAAPFDALAYAGLQVNGSCDVSQMNGSTMVAGINGAYVLDQWIVNANPTGSGGSWTNGQSTPVNTAPFGNAFPGALSVVNTAAFAPATGDAITVRQVFEGLRWVRLSWGVNNAQPVTLGFWAYSQFVTGTVTVRVINGAGNRAYNDTVTINAVNTWEYKTITIPPDVTGAWPRDNTLSCSIFLVLAAGALLVGAPLRAWGASGSTMAAAAQTNFFVAGGGNTVAVTGFTAHIGSQAPTALQSMNLARDLVRETVLCQRYYMKFTAGQFLPCIGTLRGGLAAAYWSILPTPIQMRSSPSVALGAAAAAYVGDTNAAFSSFAAYVVPGGMTINPAFGALTGAPVGSAVAAYTGSGNGIIFNAVM